ncbi:Eco47II family restriction endonuclease [Moraxellaceae bacterium AER2_44_116]|nr:Eco47II family restriction endonuclease [Moraxellaceae bacterium]TQC97450.1 Eco47II family restriction endonuclease [Moraxellaceae bacterium AER2_44_116]
MHQYNLGFISNQDLFNHVQETVLKYRFVIDLKEFNKNLVDPIKFTFDAQVYGKTIAQVVEAEVLRQLDKSNNNHIGYFHQNIFRHIGNGWTVPKAGYDVENTERQIFVEMKNKHNTMNSSSSQKTYMRMQHSINQNANALCLLVEVIATASQNRAWAISLDKTPISDERIRRVSMDKFYEMVTGDKFAFKRLCEVLPLVINDVVGTLKQSEIVQNTVLAELSAIAPDSLLKSIYLLSFQKYQGFDNFNFR